MPGMSPCIARPRGVRPLREDEGPLEKLNSKKSLSEGEQLPVRSTGLRWDAIGAAAKRPNPFPAFTSRMSDNWICWALVEC